MSLLGTSKSIWGFDPRSVPGCVLWLDATDSSTVNSGTVTSGAAVTAWSDKSGKANNATGGGSPIWSNAAINGRTAMYFSNVVGGPNLRGTFTTTVTTNTLSAFAVATSLLVPRTTQDQRLLSLSVVGGNDYDRDSGIMPFDQQANGNFSAYRTNAATSTTIVASTPYVLSFVYNATTMTGYKNGVAWAAAASVSGGALASTNYGVGCDAWTNAENWYGYIGEVIVYTLPVSTAQRQAVEGYLARKWFTTTPLAATHPYYAIQPFLRGFVPTDLPNCSLWLDGADQSSTSMTLTSSRLTTWKDKSGYGNDFTAAPFATTAPTFSNIGPLLTGPYFAALQARRNTTMTFPKVYTIFCVANQQAAAPGAYAYIMHSPFNADFILFFGTFAATHNFATFNGSGSWNDVASNAPASAVAATPTTASLLCCTNNGSNSALSLVPYFNGVAMNTKNGVNAVAFGMIIGDTSANGTGGAGSGNQPWLGGIGEIIIYGSLLTTIQRQQVEGYLASKWGIQGNLPATHPYKTIPAATVAQTINLYDDFVYGPAVTPGYVYGNLHGWTISGGIGAAGGAFDASPANTYPYYMFIQGNTATGSKAIVPTPGYTATISFSFARRGAGVGGSTVSVTVYFGSTIIYGPTNTPAVGSGWSTVTFTYLMTSAHTSISFVCGVSPATDQSLIVTNVSII